MLCVSVSSQLLVFMFVVLLTISQPEVWFRDFSLQGRFSFMKISDLAKNKVLLSACFSNKKSVVVSLSLLRFFFFLKCALHLHRFSAILILINFQH